jgi:hypothetical protein
MSVYPTSKVPARFMTLKLERLCRQLRSCQAGVAIGGAQSELSMRNGKDMTIIVLANEGKESGTRLSLGPSGVTFKLK